MILETPEADAARPVEGLRVEAQVDIVAQADVEIRQKMSKDVENIRLKMRGSGALARSAKGAPQERKSLRETR